MSTDKQIAANRANAKLSTGPKSLAGKYISSRNAATHGCLAESVLLPNESADRFRDLHRAYLDTFPPESQEMLDLVETITVARWRLRRIWTLEAANIAQEQRAQAEATQGATQAEDPPTQTVLAVRNLSLPPRSIEVLSRHEARCQRAYNQALDRLLKIQAKKQKNVDSKPIFDTNKGLTADQKPIRTIDEPPSNPHRTGDEPMVNPDRSDEPMVNPDRSDEPMVNPDRSDEPT